MRKIFKRELSFFVTIIAMFGIFAICEYANAVNVTLTARVKQADGNYSDDLVTVAANAQCSFKLLGEYNGKPPISAEIKPGTPEWKFDSTVTCVPNSDRVTKPRPAPQQWTAGETISATVIAKSSVVGTFNLTYKTQVRFPKLKKDGTPDKDTHGNLKYFGPYATSVTVTLNVTNAKFKVWIKSIDDDFPGHSLFKLGLLEKGEIKISKINKADPDLFFSHVGNIIEGQISMGSTPLLSVEINDNIIKAKTISSRGKIEVYAKDSKNNIYGPEHLEISIVKPNGIGMVRHKDYNKVKHVMGEAGAGIVGAYYILPSDVSFCQLYVAEGSDAENDGDVTLSGFFQLWYDDIKEKCEKHWRIKDDIENSTPIQIYYATQELESIENELSSVQVVDKSKFFYHKEADIKSQVHTGIPLFSGKPNTSRTPDQIHFGSVKKGSFGIAEQPGFTDGTFNWNISQSYWINEEKVSDYSRIDNLITITSNGTVTILKGNATGSATLNAPTYDFE
jgi:hypothetical protein